MLASRVIKALPLFLAARALAETRELWVNITYATGNPDGLLERKVIGLNGTWPPPPIEINVNDTLILHAHNGLDQNTAIHAHGQFFNTTAFYDGAVGVSQCGIPPGSTFSYVINTTASNSQHGTYWYHSHASGQYVDGLRAPLLIHNTPERHTYDDEYTVVLYDWYHEMHSDLMKRFLWEGNPTGAEPVPESAVMQITHKGQYLPGFTENSTIPFEAGKLYRLRLINMSALAMFRFWIDGHQMEVIEVDGVDTEATPLDLVTLSVAQRVSVLVRALDTTTSNYLIHANMDPDMFDVVPDDLILNVTSTITYSTNNPVAPATEVAYAEFPDQSLVPLDVIPTAEADVSFELGFNFDTADDGIPRSFFALSPSPHSKPNITYQTPVVPGYLTATTMGEDAWNPAVYGQTNPMVVRHGQMVEMKIINWDAGFHPFHLHGHRFQLVSETHAGENETASPASFNAMQRDTVMVPPDGGSRVIRFRADNPGVWIFHCHIEWHLEQGLAAVLIEAPDVLQAYVGVPEFLHDQCRALGFATSGNAAGWNSTTDFRGLTTGPYIQELGWHAKGIGAMVGCILTALLGIASIIWYSMGSLDDDEMESEVADAIQKKEAAKSAKAQGLKKLFMRS